MDAIKPRRLRCSSGLQSSLAHSKQHNYRRQLIKLNTMCYDLGDETRYFIATIYEVGDGAFKCITYKIRSLLRSK